jgi:hypothetical protein
METMTKKQIPNITPELIRATKAVFLAQAFTQTIRPIVEGYQQKVINELKPLNMDTLEVITSFKDSYTMTDCQFSEYFRLCNIEREKAGLKVENPEFCPLLVAEDMERKANRNLLEQAEYITHLSPDDVLCSVKGLENYNKLVDLTLRFMAGYCKDHRIELNALKS